MKKEKRQEIKERKAIKQNHYTWQWKWQEALIIFNKKISKIDRWCLAWSKSLQAWNHKADLNEKFTSRDSMHWFFIHSSI